MTKYDKIKEFEEARPEACGVYGYGSGVFKQVGHNDAKTLIDVIFIVDDIKEWHRENMEMNPNDYSMIGRLHLSRENVKKLKGKNNITYLSEIPYNGCVFKYGVVEVEDFERNLTTWDNFFVTGRFHKPVLEVKTNEDIAFAIDENRRKAIMVACLLLGKQTVTSNQIYNTICGLSYLGDARMAIAENPHKVENIVMGSYSLFQEIYPLQEDYLKVVGDGEFVNIDFPTLIGRIYELPAALLGYIDANGVDTSNVRAISQAIREFLHTENRRESKAQIVEGIKTNGICRSIPYGLAKVKKRFSK